MMISQSIYLIPGTAIAPIFTGRSTSRIDWLSCRHNIKSQPPIIAPLQRLPLDPYQNYPPLVGSAFAPMPRLILYFSTGGAWIEWGEAPLYAARVRDEQIDSKQWGVFDVLNYFTRERPLAMGAGFSLGCKLSYASPADQVIIVGCASFERGAIQSIESAPTIGSVAIEVAPAMDRQSIYIENAGANPIRLRLGQAPTASLFFRELAPTEFVQIATNESVWAAAVTGSSSLSIQDERWL